MIDEDFAPFEPAASSISDHEPAHRLRSSRLEPLALAGCEHPRYGLEAFSMCRPAAPIRSRAATACASSSSARTTSRTSTPSTAAGRISMPLIGTVQVAGRTTEQVEEAIAAKLRAGYHPRAEGDGRDRRLPSLLRPRRGDDFRPVPLRERHDRADGGRDRRRLHAARPRKDYAEVTRIDRYGPADHRGGSDHLCRCGRATRSSSRSAGFERRDRIRGRSRSRPPASPTRAVGCASSTSSARRSAGSSATSSTWRAPRSRAGWRSASSAIPRPAASAPPRRSPSFGRVSSSASPACRCGATRTRSTPPRS